MSDPQTSLLETIVDTVIAECNAALTAAGMTVPPGPGFVHTAPVIPLGVQTCPDILAVWLDKIDARPRGEGQPIAPGGLQFSGFHTVAPLRIDYWRYMATLTDTGSDPDPADTRLNSGQLARGAWAIWCRLAADVAAGTLFTNIGSNLTPISRRDVGIGSMTPLVPQGYAAGWRITLEVMLPATFS